MLESYTRGKTVTIKLDSGFNCKCFNNIKSIYSHAEPGSEFVLDLAKVSTIDCSSIGIMLVMREELPNSQNKIICTNCQPKVMEIFEFSNMVNLFNFPQAKNAA